MTNICPICDSLLIEESSRFSSDKTVICFYEEDHYVEVHSLKFTFKENHVVIYALKDFQFNIIYNKLNEKVYIFGNNTNVTLQDNNIDNAINYCKKIIKLRVLA